MGKRISKLPKPDRSGFFNVKDILPPLGVPFVYRHQHRLGFWNLGVHGGLHRKDELFFFTHWKPLEWCDEYGIEP